MRRRSFLGYFLTMLGAASAQQAIMEGKKAVVCDDPPVKCPNNHDTCRTINKPLALGNDSYDYPEVAQLRGYNVICCDVCGVLFVHK